MLVVVFLVCFSEMEFFVFSKKKFFFDNFFGVLFPDRSASYYVLVVVVFFVCFSLIELSVFLDFLVFFVLISFHLTDHLVACKCTVSL